MVSASWHFSVFLNSGVGYPSLADAHLSASAQYFVDDVCLLLHREGVLDLSREGGPGPEHGTDVEVLPDPLNH